MEIVNIEDYAKLWHSTVPEPGTYNFGERRYTQYALFLSKSGFSQEGWDYWLNRLTSSDKLERQFIKYLIKYRFHTRQAIMINNIRKNVKIEADAISSYQDSGSPE